MGILAWIVVGLVAGVLASLVMGGTGYGIIGDIVIGIVGAFIGGWLFSVLGIGLLKPNVSAIVADLYPEGGARLDSGFTIFYIGINIGVAAPMAYFPFSGWKESFFGILHGQGRDAVEFFTESKIVIERWSRQETRKF